MRASWPTEALGLGPPSPPAQTHHHQRQGMGNFPSGKRKDRLDRARRFLEESSRFHQRIHRSGGAGLSVCRLITESTDRLVIGLWRELHDELSPPAGLSLVALGSYGRRELAPHSDLDLLLLKARSTAEEKTRRFAEALHTLLWDLKCSVGWSARTAAECARAAEDDHTVRTALLDCRSVCGDEATYQSLTEGFLRDLLARRADAFIADKSRELRLRRERYGDSIYLLEPNLKLGEGGLRDLEAALWIAYARFRAKGLRALLQQSVLPRSEVDLLTAARDFLLRIRNHLHYASGRKEDRLTFDLQEQVAAFLGYQSNGEGLAVEQFMRHYYLSAKAIRRAADALIERCEEARQRRGPFLPERRLGPFKVFRGKLTLEGTGELLEREPAAILRLFRAADELCVPIYSWAKDQIVQALPALEKARDQLPVVGELKALLQRPETDGRFLFEMHELGALGAVLPEFGRVTAMHQHDLYHVYTVDVHTLFALRRLYALRRGDLVEQEPELSRQMRDLEDPLPLYIGLLFHDAGKGMGGDHSRRGAELVARVSERLQLSARQKEICEFLVLQHLLMSHTAQRRDLSDPELIADFARRVGDAEKLSCLYLLTYADICSVGPKMWSEWKAQLLAELYQKCRAQLFTESRPTAEHLLSEAKGKFIRGWETALGKSNAEAFGRALPARYFLSIDPANAPLHGRLLLRARRQALAAVLKHRRDAGFSELTLCAADRPGLLAQFAGVLSAHRMDILRSRIASTSDGLALDVFDLMAPQGQLVDHARWKAARTDLIRVLTGEATVESILARRRGSSLLSRRLPSVATRISVDNRASQHFTVIDVRAEDQVGLLYAIASSLTGMGLQIALAKVATEAHRAIDSFYVTTTEGEKLLDPGQIEAATSMLRRAIDALTTGSSPGR